VYRVSVVVTANGDRDVVPSSVRLLGRSADVPPFEVVAVVHGGAAPVVSSASPPLRVVHAPGAGPAAAFNHGAAAASGELLLFLDGRRQAPPGLLATHDRHHRQGAHAVVGPPDHATPPPRASVPFEVAHLHHIHFRETSIHRDVFQRLGGFDERFDGGGAARAGGADLGYRLLRAGYRLRFDRSGAAHRDDAAAILRQSRECGRAAVALVRKHPELAGPLLGPGRHGPGRHPVARRCALAQPRLSGLTAAALAPLAVRRHGRPGPSRWRPSGRSATGAAWPRRAGSPAPAPCGCCATTPSPTWPATRWSSPTGSRRRGSATSSTACAGPATTSSTPTSCWPIWTAGPACQAAAAADLRRLLRRPALGGPARAGGPGHPRGGVRRQRLHRGQQPLGSGGRGGDPALLDVGGLETLERSGLEIGAHSRTHRSLTEVDAAELAGETAGVATDLEGAGLRSPRLFAYPYGDQSAEVRQAVRRAGYAAAFTVSPGRVLSSSDRYALPRVDIRRHHSGLRFRLRVALLGGGRLRRSARLLRRDRPTTW
jgi:hypothetical protein